MRDLERRAVALDLVAADESAEGVGVIEQALVERGELRVVIDEKPGRRAAARLKHRRQLTGQLAEGSAAERVGPAAAGAAKEPPAKVRLLGDVHEPAAGEL